MIPSHLLRVKPSVVRFGLYLLPLQTTCHMSFPSLTRLDERGRASRSPFFSFPYSYLSDSELFMNARPRECSTVFLCLSLLIETHSVL